MKTRCQAGSFALITESASRYSADRQQAAVAAWPPCAVAVLAPLPRCRPQGGHVCLPSHSPSFSISFSRASEEL